MRPRQFFQAPLFKDLLATLAGGIQVYAYAPYNIYGLSLLSMAVFLLCLQNQRPQRAILHGYLFGLGLFVNGLQWVYISLHEFGGAATGLAVLLTLAFAGFWALFPALSAFFICRFARTSFQRIFLPATIWTLTEYLRGQLIFNGFPLFEISYSLLQSPFAGYIPVFGGYFAGFLALLAVSLLVEFMLAKNKSRQIYAYFLLLILLSGNGLSRLAWTQEQGKVIDVLMIQGNIAQDQKWQPQYRNEILKYYRQTTEQHWGSDIIIWPESAIPAYYQQVKRHFIEPLAQAATDHGSSLILSLPEKDQQGRKFNSVMTFGTGNGVHRKIHLLPFGEYLPLQDLFASISESLAIMPLGNFTPGRLAQPLMQAAGYPFLTSVCYEGAFGAENALRAGQAAFLVNVTNDGWFGRSNEPYVHMQLAQMRALETRRYLLRATNNGITAIVNPNGDIIKQAQPFIRTTLAGAIMPRSGYTPYMRWGDKPFIIGMLLLVSYSLLSACKSKGKLLSGTSGSV